MTLEDLRNQVLDFPWPIVAYDDWRQRQKASRTAGGMLGIFAADLGFGLRDDDVVALTSWEVSVEDGADGAVIRSPLGEATVEGVDAASIRRLLERVDGARTAAEVVGTPSFMKYEGWAILDALVGHAVTAPGAVRALESKVPGSAIVRFPTTPYAVLRNYWQNMGDLWSRRAEIPTAVDDVAGFSRWLRDLHITAVMGASLDCFYKPGSPVSDRRVYPGTFDRQGTWVAGDTMRSSYFLLLAGMHDDPVIFNDGWVDESSGVRFGELRHLTLRGGRGPVWLPERPVREEHLAVLAQELGAASSQGDRGRRLEHLARFHQIFVRLHPFACANQCIAMGLVNAVLATEEGIVLPHLHLDYCALLLGTESYARVFASAVDALASRQGDDKVYDVFEPRRRAAIAFVRRLLACKSPAEAHELLSAEPEDAALVLLSPP